LSTSECLHFGRSGGGERGLMHSRGMAGHEEEDIISDGGEGLEYMLLKKSSWGNRLSFVS